MASEEVSTVGHFLPPDHWIRFAVWNCPVFLVIYGIIPAGTVYDGEYLDHYHLAWQSSLQVNVDFLEEDSFDELAYYMGLFLLEQVKITYMTSNVPDEMVWLGNVRVGLNMN